MCCQGCLAVASLISGAGLENYYRHRQQLADKAFENPADAAQAWQGINDRETLWGSQAANGKRDLLLQVTGIRCAACAWLIRSHLEKQAGIDAVQVDTSTGFCRIQWSPELTRLSDIAACLFRIGYTPHLPLAQAEEDGRRKERLDSLKRLGVAGLGMMQVMMYAVGLYAGEAYGISAASRGFLSWVSLLVTLPVLLYSGRIFFQGAWRGIRNGRPGMDLPVALAIGLAFLASCYHFFIGSGEIWFDSVVMFIFFLSLGRHVELVLRQKNLQAGNALSRLLPEWADKLDSQGRIQLVPAADLVPGDRVRVAAGASFPADGIILNGVSEVDESLLTGESIAIAKSAGEQVIAGSINLLQSIEMEVQAAHDESTVSNLGRLLLAAQARRSEDSGLPGWLVPTFTVTVLLITLGAWTFWQWQNPALAFSVALAVLVASCPCALSLALPVVRSAASLALLKQGVLLTRPSALADLLSVDHIVFDKTGTLTLGKPEIVRIDINPERSDFDRDSALALAAGIESHSRHPVAMAFRKVDSPRTIQSVIHHPGSGLEAQQGQQRIRLGSRNFALAIGSKKVSNLKPDQAPANPDEISEKAICLADQDGWIASFHVKDVLRPETEQLIEQLRSSALTLTICSGDSESAVQEIAGRLGISSYKFRQKPDDKIRYINELKSINRNVLMVGDGVNDAPVLAAANVSMTVSGASELANSAADFILTGNSLRGLASSFKAAQKAQKLVKQNLTWALLYNLGVLPLAVSGLLQPWMAALGMSASSLVVVLNATRMSHQMPGSGNLDSLNRPVAASR